MTGPVLTGVNVASSMRGICGYNCDICCYKAVASGFYSNGNLQSVFFTARRYASVVFAVVVCPSVRLSVRHKPALYRNYCTNRALILPIPHCGIRKFRYHQKLGYFPLELCSKHNISPQQIDHFVNKTRRRRRRSSLLTTPIPIRQSTSRGCLLQVGQL